MTPVTDPELIAQLKAAEAAAQPAQPQGTRVTDPVLIRQLQAQEAGFMAPQEGEAWFDKKSNTQYRVSGGKTQKKDLKAALANFSRRYGQPDTGAGLPQDWTDVGPDEDLTAAHSAAIENLPGMKYSGPQGAGPLARTGVAAKQVLLDMATPDQNVQADFLVNNFTPDRGYTFVPVGDDRVMLVHQDKETGKVTRQLVNAKGLSVGDLVHMAPHAAAAVATGGATAGLSSVGRVVAQGAIAGTVTAGQEGGLKAAGNERGFDVNRVLADAAMGAGGEALANTIGSAVRSNGVIRNAVEDTIAWASGRLRQPPNITNELAAALREANISTHQFRSLAINMQRDMARRLPAAQARGGNIADDANQTARNATEIARQGGTPTHFHAGTNQDDKALFGAAIRGEHGRDAEGLARAIDERAATEATGRFDTIQGHVAGVHGSPVMTELGDSMHMLGNSLQQAATADRTAAGAAVEAAKNQPALIANEFRIRDRQRLLSSLTAGMRSDGVQPGTPAAEAYIAVQNWVANRTNRQIGNQRLDAATTEDLRRSLRRLATDAGQGTPDSNAINNLIDHVDNWVTSAAQRSPRPGAGAVATQTSDARAQYARYIADYVAERPAGRGQTTRGDTVNNIVTRYANELDTLTDSLLGRNGALANPGARDELAALVDHLGGRIANAHWNPHARASNRSRLDPRSDAWDALRQSVMNKIFRNPDGGIRPYADIRRDLDRIGTSPSGQRILSGLYSRREMQMFESGARMLDILGTATRNTRSAGYLNRVGDGTITGRLRSMTRAAGQTLNYVFRYHAVRGLHEGRMLSVAANALAVLAPERAAQWVNSAMISGLLRKGAQDPMYAFRGIRGQAGAGERVAGLSLSKIIAPDFEPQDENERRFTTIIDRIGK